MNDFTHGATESTGMTGRVQDDLINSPPCVYFFDAPENKIRLIAEAARWLGTPFVAHAQVQGSGVDCVNLVAAIYQACGFLREFNPPRYSMDGGKHSAKSQLIDWLESSGRFKEVTTPQLGDTLCFLWRGQSEHHAGLMLDGSDFIHVMERRKVEVSFLKDRTYARILTAIYRPLA